VFRAHGAARDPDGRRRAASRARPAARAVLARAVAFASSPARSRGSLEAARRRAATLDVAYAPARGVARARSRTVGLARAPSFRGDDRQRMDSFPPAREL